ncbi:MAG: phosphoglycerate dehydrogenase [Chloroflexi bacterium]|nr:phosphoglycerate dehydrogenase [Chloroflexota bacterium]
MDRILVTEKIGAEGLAALKEVAEVDVRLDLTPETLLEALPQYDALIVRSQTKVTAKVLAAGTKLRVVGRAGTGVDNIDLAAANQQGILVVNAPASNSIAVAELTIGLMIGLARNIPQAHTALQNGKWERSKYGGWEVRGKTLGLVGFGRIASEVARRARALEMNIIAYDPIINAERAAQLGVTPVTLDELTSRADVISLHIPLIDATRNLFDAQRLSQMKKGSYIINCARGGVIDEEALFEALESGHLGGAALDVFAKEPPTGPIVTHPKAIVLPHLGASTEEAQALTAADVAEGIVDVLAGRSPRYAVNAPFVAPEEWAIVGPYLDLGRKLARLSTQLVDLPAQSYQIVYNGALAGLTSEPIKLAVLQGLLEGGSEGRVTPVNAPFLARERGLTINETHRPDAETYTELLQLVVTTSDGVVHTFGGTVVRGEAHIVQINEFWLDLVPTSSMLFTFHQDRPGFIGRIGTLLGTADINISAMHVGRSSPRGTAIMVLTVDEAIPSETLTDINNQADIERAYSVLL